MTIPSPTISKRSSRRAAKPKPRFGDWLQQWLVVRDEATVLSERQGDLRNRIVDALEEFGEPDDKGNSWYELESPIEFTDHDGKVFKYSILKRERHLTPANPTPDVEKAEELLREKGLWLTEAQEAALTKIQTKAKFVEISISVDVDAVAKAYFAGVITEAEYDSILREQKESFQFRPAEA